MLLDKCLKSPLSEDPSTSNMVDGPKHWRKLDDRPLPYLLIAVKAIQSEKICLIDMQNLRTFC